MNMNAFPTKGNLIIIKNSLKLAQQGYELMDKKRNILISELTTLIDEAKNIQNEIDQTFTKAYRALQEANIELGIDYVQEIAEATKVDETVMIKSRSVMGTEIPLAQIDQSDLKPAFSFYGTRDSLDEAMVAFDRVKKLTVRLSTVENTAYRLAASIKKTQKRANALQNITIPTYSSLYKNIQAALDEKEREEFTRLKVIKKNKSKQSK